MSSVDKNRDVADSFITDEELQPEVLARWNEVVGMVNLPTNDTQLRTLDRAFRFAAKAHEGQTRLTGEPYITHPVEVVAILAELNVDNVTLLGALLHDVVEDTGVEMEEVAHHFGPVVGLLVEGMTKLAALRYESKSNEDRQAEYFRKMLLSMAQDMRVILIKLADRLHNMRTLDAMPPKSRKRIAEETVEIYAPLAHRFGVGRVKWELEDLSLKVLDEVAYRKIAERVKMKRGERERAINAFISPLEERLNSEGIDARISGRAKHFYSIYNKIKRRGKSFEEILDLLAVRVIVPSISDCYRTLGTVHSVYKPILERFSDYIAMPKANMYQSLHTKVIDKEGRIVEVQIRTEDMDRVAEVGIAAHWQYKEGGGDGGGKEDALADYYLWLRQLIEGSKEESSSEEFMRTLKVNLFTDEVFVFTPRGKLIQLAKGSTPIDFAFAVHTDVGLTTLGAKVNGKMVRLDYQLLNGDTVEILTSSNSKPSWEWLRFVNTHRARSKIKKYFRQAHYEESVHLGEEMLKRELSRAKLRLSDGDFPDLADRYGYDSPHGLYAAIGTGDLSTASVINRIRGDRAKENQVEERPRFLAGARRENIGVRVKGADNLMIGFGNCCNPLPGDKIIGFISKGRGIQVHRNDCPNIADLTKEKDRLVEVDWDVSAQDRFNARLRIVSEDRQHLLRDLAEVIAKADVNVLEMNLRAEAGIGVATVVLSVRSLSHLTRLRSKIGKLKGVVQVERVGVAEVAERVL